MKHNTRRLFTLLTALVCIGLLAGCGTDTAENDTADGGTNTPVSSEAADAATGTDAAETEDLIGEVTYVSDSYIRLSVYQSDTEITDYTDLGSAVLTDTGSSEAVILDSDAVFEYVSSGILYSTTADGVTVGDIIAVTATEDGIQEFIVLDYTAPTQSEDATEGDGSSDAQDGGSATEDGGSDAAQDGSTSGDAENGSDASPEPTGTPSADSGDSTLVTAAA